MLGILGIPMDLGANVKGSREGPDKIRQYLLPLLKQKGIAYEDFGNVPVYDDHRETDPTRKNYGEIEHTCV
ncbi:MAG: arginase family protein, partial [Candidatus Aenigmarchaeota archaeon]|nr:arginase family protein [Candidatus Aenigmarchaeota archaeon]